VRTITVEDCELLRLWKNAYRDRFFFKDEITPAMQDQWFRSYLLRNDDHMLVVLDEDRRIGCLGFRRLEDRIDFYNIIRGIPSPAGRGAMTAALDLACSHARARYPGLPVMVSVLKTNPALGWYLRRGFALTEEHETFVELTRDA
jgi:RimJ/RimL family protein N-acetyltransferase